MFKRRKPLSPLRMLKEIFWPTMGYIRAAKYICRRIVRLSDTTPRIASGLAIGVSVSFSPFLGTHFIQATALAFVTRSNLPASLIGTFSGNPWTFPFMWWASLSLGSFLLSFVGVDAQTALPDHMTINIFWELVTNEPIRILLPWLIGGYLLAFLTWPLSFVIFYNMVSGAKLARKKARLRKVHKVAKEITEQSKS